MAFQNIIMALENVWGIDPVTLLLPNSTFRDGVGLGDVTSSFVLCSRRLWLISRWRILKTRRAEMMIEPTMHVTKEGADTRDEIACLSWKQLHNFWGMSYVVSCSVVLGLKWLWRHKQKQNKKNTGRGYCWKSGDGFIVRWK